MKLQSAPKSPFDNIYTLHREFCDAEALICQHAPVSQIDTNLFSRRKEICHDISWHGVPKAFYVEFKYLKATL